MRHALLLGLLLITGCSSVSAEAPRPSQPVVAVYPAFDAKHARPDRGLVVHTRGGTLNQVLAYAGDKLVTGKLDPTRTTWHSDWTLAPDTEYTVTATATRPGTPATVAMGRFRTRPAVQGFQVASAEPLPDETVGVGMPIILNFDSPVRDKAVVERALEVKASKPVEGAWHWINDTQVVYRTRSYWPARQRVTVTAHLSGVRPTLGMYGTADTTFSFTVGRKQTSTIDTVAHQMLVRRDGKIVQRMAISAGMATTKEYTTTSGVHLTMDKGNPVRMISPGRKKGDPGFYDVMIDHAVRISNSGEYVHAKNNLWAQGRANVSHGCVNARPDQATWFFDSSLRGDPVTITGTTRVLEWDNGWGFWQLPWEKWQLGSALYDPTPAGGWVRQAPPPTLP
ncbi:Ig-like domain-containing protein [Nonomuraea sp. NPDC050536]|uniref:L,D-transpeptidase n=1 Tax=Nonomuraea sp. NPDC050536 TaxID=3364366 RepID=UPI0037CB8743